jgi:chromosome segregation ATPase
MTETITAAVMASLITATIGFLGVYVMYRYQMQKDAKANFLDVARAKADADGALFIRLSSHLRELDAQLKEVRNELEEEREKRRIELEEEREKRRLLETRVEILESEKAEIGKERDAALQRSVSLQAQVNALMVQVGVLEND